MRRRLVPGDVLELSRQKGLLYIQFVGTDPGLGDGVRVSPKFWETRPVISPALFDGGYFIFYPAALAVSKRMAIIIGSLPTTALPTTVRMPRDFESDGRIHTWAIRSPEGVVVKADLTDDELDYPIAEILNDAALVEGVAAGWHPAKRTDRM